MVNHLLCGGVRNLLRQVSNVELCSIRVYSELTRLNKLGDVGRLPGHVRDAHYGDYALRRVPGVLAPSPDNLVIMA